MFRFESVRALFWLVLPGETHNITRVTYLVLDEADRMLDRGFENDIRRIIERTADASERQTVMCKLPRLYHPSLSLNLPHFKVSATWPESVRRLASTFQKDPLRITVGSEDLTANGRVEQGESRARHCSSPRN